MIFDSIKFDDLGIQLRWVLPEGGFYRKIIGPDEEVKFFIPSSVKDQINTFWTPERRNFYYDMSKPSEIELLDKPVPVLTPRQIRLALLAIDITEEDIDTILAENSMGMIEWKFATQFKRNHPLLVSLAEIFELPQEQVNALWEWASEL